LQQIHRYTCFKTFHIRPLQTVCLSF
jgi:hypothetical protein